ncbi:NAD(P)/FAD-dependent oxidoreductase [Hansschlegelia quercus]|uniref:FAD-binding protein n=1 Tax=Hansschlegelia quercus TaxID=2528245 RepID=A0A4Q9GGZ8_9HYPH|nr:FAD-dependent oxidoreductase [Hansschlegelia quercus]TBN53403.1 FAD-binding protein [Hansschlegelia quercus]
MATPRVAIVGAGIAGLAAARVLADAGCAVRVFDKGRAIGGRLAHRRSDFGGFDHGAQYVRAEGETFRFYLEEAEQAGAIARWPAMEAAAGDGRPVYVGAPGMSGLVAPLAKGLDILSGVTVAAASLSDDGWRLGADDDSFLGRFDALVVAIPAPQALELFEGHPVADPLLGATYAPCLAGLFAFESLSGMPEVAREEDGPLAWVAHDGGKPGRGEAATIAVHAGADWSQSHLETPKGAVAAALLMALKARHPALGEPTHVDAHRWLYARVEQALGVACVFDADARLAFCGDYCLGPRVEAAFDSGRAAGEALRATLV